MMKNPMKRKLSLVLAFLMTVTTLCASFSFSAFAEGEEAMVFGGESYATIDEAIANVPEGGKVVLLKDVTVSSAFSIPQDKKFTFSGGEYTLTCGSTNLFEIAQTGIEFTIENGNYVGTGSGSFIAVTATGTNAKIEIQDGTFTNTAGNGHWIGLIVQLNSDCQLTIQNGTFLTGTTRSFAAADDNDRTNLSVVVNGGSFINHFGRFFNVSGINLTVNGGSFKITDADWNTRPLIQINSGTLNITGGSFVVPATDEGNKGAIASFMVYGDTSRVNISGGRFRNDTNSIFSLNGASSITIYDGYFDSLVAPQNTIMMNNSSSLTVYGGVFASRYSPIYLNSASTTCNLYGGHFLAMNSNKGIAASGSGAVNRVHYQVSCRAVVGDITNDNKVEYTPISPIDGAETVYTTSLKKIPALLNGASVRLVPDSSGLRFSSVISQEIIEYAEAQKDSETMVSYGTVIAPTDYLSDLYSFTMNALESNGKIYLNIEAKNGIVDNQDGSKTINAAIVDILPGNISRSFSAVSYVKYVKDGISVYIYSNYDNTNNSRSIRQVAQAAIDSGDYSSDAAALEILNGYLQ